MVGYHGVVSPSRPQRQSGTSARISQTVTPSAPARCATAVSDDGTIIAGTSSSALGGLEAFVYDDLDGMRGLGFLEEGFSSFAVDIENYILMTLHRAENVDHKKTLSSIISAILETKHNVIFPVHPRTVKRLKEFNLYSKLQKSENILLLDSVGYFEMLELMKNCSFIVTDSGGIQEEATAPKIRKKVLVTRKTTDRPEAVTAGMSIVIGVEKKNIVQAIKKTILNPSISSRTNPYGKGDASQKIIKILQKNL